MDQQRVEAELPGDLRAPRMARTWMAEQLAPVGLAPADCEAALLLVSELVTNVVTHTASAPTLILETRSDRILVEVADTDAAPAAIREDDAAAVGGWGLRIVDEVASDWGVRSGDGAKVVWFTIERDRS